MEIFYAIWVLCSILMTLEWYLFDVDMTLSQYEEKMKEVGYNKPLSEKDLKVYKIKILVLNLSPLSIFLVFVRIASLLIASFSNGGEKNK